MKIHIISEIGSNWEGDIELGKIHIKKSKECGAHFVKFQMWRANDLYDESHPHWIEIKKSELTEAAAKELKKYADKIGIKWFCSVFYPEAVDILESLDVPFYKIASRTATLKDNFSLETIRKVGTTNKLTFVSTGEGADKEKIKKQFPNINPQFTYCVAKYPTPDADINWNELLNFDFFSDHTLEITIPLVYCSLKNFTSNNDIYIEKHVKLDNNKGPDSSFAISYNKLADMVYHVQRIEKLVTRHI